MHSSNSVFNFINFLSHCTRLVTFLCFISSPDKKCLDALPLLTNCFHALFKLLTCLHALAI